MKQDYARACCAFWYSGEDLLRVDLTILSDLRTISFDEWEDR